MLAYTNEAIMAMYEAIRETDTVFAKVEAYPQAVREAYLQWINKGLDIIEEKAEVVDGDTKK